MRLASRSVRSWGPESVNGRAVEKRAAVAALFLSETGLWTAPTNDFGASVVGHAEHQLAKILAFEQHVEGFRKGIQAVDNVFA